ncbi:Mce-associated membrane protein [Amycolatopsis marina]|uniref:Mce-associated membrane protein n=1 Tax=Amycolatopsis marina TaxID=490629 RepID=A0A1I0ZYG9_9PSEU|nr:hypothetical protein [Amycolatopsis marina]SFB30779.1 Mce-associated membrane protein [Amycolatopsis marina]
MAAEAVEPTSDTASTEPTASTENADVAQPPEAGTAEAEVGEVDALTGEPEVDQQQPKPSPRRKARDTGVPKPSSETEIDTDQLEQADAEPAKGRETDAEEGAAVGATAVTGGAGSRRSRTPLIVGLLVIAVLFAGLAVFFRIQGAEAQSATNNTALVDVARTAQVKQETGAAVERLFSYDYNDMEKTEKAADELLLTDEVREQYAQLLSEVKREAPKQKMVVTAKVTRSGVIMLDDNRAKVLLFIDQTSTRTDKNQTSAGGAQMSVDAEFRDGAWKITNLNAYNDLPQSAPAPEGEKAPEGN